jgi:hypothetical protein
MDALANTMIGAALVKSRIIGWQHISGFDRLSSTIRIEFTASEGFYPRHLKGLFFIS